jgi:uncharacterized membrane protein
MISAISVFYMFCNTFLAAFAVLHLKKGTNGHSFPRLFLTRDFWLSILLYAIATGFYLLALFKEDLTFVFPFGALVYVWAVLFSVKFLGEKMDNAKYTALAGIVVGILLISLES